MMSEFVAGAVSVDDAIPEEGCGGCGAQKSKTRCSGDMLKAAAIIVEKCLEVPVMFNPNNAEHVKVAAYYLQNNIAGKDGMLVKLEMPTDPELKNLLLMTVQQGVRADLMESLKKAAKQIVQQFVNSTSLYVADNPNHREVVAYYLQGEVVLENGRTVRLAVPEDRNILGWFDSLLKRSVDASLAAARS